VPGVGLENKKYFSGCPISPGIPDHRDMQALLRSSLAPKINYNPVPNINKNLPQKR
jgi:hypothetical protein